MPLRPYLACSLLTALGVASAAAQAWTPIADMPRFRQEHSAVSVDDRHVYLIGGIGSRFDPVVEIDRFDTQTGAWAPAVAALPAGRERHHFNAVVYEGEVYVAGGKTAGDTTGVTWVDKWNPATGEWTVLPDLPQVHWGGPSILNGDGLHVVTGAIDRTTATKHHFRLDLAAPDDGWERLRVLPQPSVHAAGFALNDKLYVISGESGHHHPNEDEPQTVYEYDPPTNEWATVTDFPVHRNHAEWSTFAHDGKAYSISGNDNTATPRAQDSIYVSSDPSAPDGWSQPLPSLPVPLIGPSAVVVDDRLWVMGGWQNDWDSDDRSLAGWVLDLEDPSGLEGDLDGNGVVDGGDLALWAAAYGDAGPGLAADRNANGAVDAADYSLLRNDFTPQAGDYNRDGQTDGNDYSVWSADYGGAAPFADANADGVVDASDYTAWRDAVPSAAPVPEPVAAAVVLGALVGVTLCRRAVA